MPDSTVPSDVVTLAEQLADAQPMRRGSLSERYVKCSKPDCPCCESEDARHGPYYSVSRVVNRKTQSRWLNTEEAKIVRRQVEQGQKFRKKVEAYWEACERWADASLPCQGPPVGCRQGHLRPPAATWLNSGQNSDAMNWTTAKSTTSSARLPFTSKLTTKPASALITSDGTVTACVIRSSALKASALVPALSRQAVRLR